MKFVYVVTAIKPTDKPCLNVGLGILVDSIREVYSNQFVAICKSARIAQLTGWETETWLAIEYIDLTGKNTIRNLDLIAVSPIQLNLNN